MSQNPELPASAKFSLTYLIVLIYEEKVNTQAQNFMSVFITEPIYEFDHVEERFTILRQRCLQNVVGKYHL